MRQTAEALWGSDPDFVPLDGTLAECDRTGDGRGDYSAKHHRYGVNVLVVTDPTGKVCGSRPRCRTWRTHNADRAYQGAGPQATTGLKRPPGGEPTPTQRTVNRALAQARAPRRTQHGTAEVQPASAPTA